MANEWYTQGRTSIDNPYVDEKSWYNYDNAPPTGVNYPNLGGPLYPETTQPRVPDWISSPNRPAIPERTGFNFDLSGITGPVMGGLKWLGDKFQRPDAKQKAYDAIMGDRKGLGLWDTQTGTYGGNEYDLTRTPSGLKVYSEVNPFGKNFDSGFGSQSLEEMDEKTLAWAAERLRTGKGLSQRLRNILAKRGRLNVTGVDRVGQDQTVDTRTTGGAPVTTGGGGTFNPAMDPRGRRDPTPSWHGATEARGQTFRDTGGQQGQVAGPGFGRGAYWAKGGRVGLYGGGDPDEPTEDIFEFIKDQNIPIGEQVQGDPFDLRIQELMGKGLSYDDAYDIAAHEFQDLFAEGPDQDQGLASLV